MTQIDRLPAAVAEVWDWQVRAACRTMSTSLFFHPWGERGSSRSERVRMAKEVRAGCPVVDACLRHSLEVAELYGVWGGLSEEERMVLLNRGRNRSRLRPAASATVVATEPEAGARGHVGVVAETTRFHTPAPAGVTAATRR